MRPIATFIVFVLFCWACNPATRMNSSASNAAMDHRDSLRKNLYGISSIVFGKYCGHCMQNCNAFFHYSKNGGTDTLRSDLSMAFTRGGELTFPTVLADAESKELAAGVYANLPRTLLTLPVTDSIIGCPDCADQCGVYVEIRQGNGVRKYRIDTQESSLEGDIKAFSVYIQPVIQQLKEKK